MAYLLCFKRLSSYYIFHFYRHRSLHNSKNSSYLYDDDSYNSQSTMSYKTQFCRTECLHNKDDNKTPENK